MYEFVYAIRDAGFICLIISLLLLIFFQVIQISLDK